tara:strand:- start:2009 stop:2341 length:333 start_codon:yes stop_codon:yes gene_type:complete
MKVQQRTSVFIKNIETSLRNKTATVYFKSGDVYKYSDVSRRAIINLSLNPSLSFGFWFNKVLKENENFQLVPSSNDYLSDLKGPTEEELLIIEQELEDEYNEEYATANAW